MKKKSLQSNAGWTRTIPVAQKLVEVPFAILIILFSSSLVTAQVNWTNTTNSDAWYQSSLNWSPWGAPTAMEMAQFNAASAYEVWWSGSTQTQTPTVGFLNVTAGDVRFANQQISAQYELTINGSGGNGSPSDFSIQGANTILMASGIHLHSLGGARILDGATFTLQSHRAGSQFTTDGSSGFNIDGDFNVLGGSIATNAVISRIGSVGGSVGNVKISGPGSLWMPQVVRAGASGQGSLLIESGGVVNSFSGIVGDSTTGVGSVTVTGGGSQWSNTNSLTIGSYGDGELIIEQGGVVSSNFATIGASKIGNQAGNGTVSVNGVGAELNLSSSLYVGLSGTGVVNVNGGQLTSHNAYVGRETGSSGEILIQGSSGSWVHTGNFFWVGENGIGTLTIDGGDVTSGSNNRLGEYQDGDGTVVVKNNGLWTNSGMSLASEGAARLTIESGGKVITTGNSSTSSYLTGTANISISGVNSLWETSGDFNLGGGNNAGSSTMDILGGKVTTGGTTIIGPGTTINLDGGRFEFGQTSLDEYNSINQLSGSMAGLVLATGYRTVNSLAAFRNSGVDISDVNYGNQGVLQGGGVMDSGLANQTSGEVRILSGESTRFAGNTNTNAGEINNFGGVIEFEKSIRNESTGFVSGRGQFIAQEGWTNAGVMAFSGGPADILGDFINESGGQIVTTGGATTTFFDDVVHNGTEIRTATGSNSVFFGEVSGAGPFTGIGTVFFEGDLRPGNSPDIVTFEGDVVLGTGARTSIEIAGMLDGNFDKLIVDGDLYLDGGLQVDLLDGFSLDLNQQFLIAEIGGSLFGEFDGLGQGDLVGSFGGRELFISYSAGNGNDISLFSAVPEPGTGVLLGLGVLGLFVNHRRRKPESRKCD